LAYEWHLCPMSEANIIFHFLLIEFLLFPPISLFCSENILTAFLPLFLFPPFCVSIIRSAILLFIYPRVFLPHTFPLKHAHSYACDHFFFAIIAFLDVLYSFCLCLSFLYSFIVIAFKFFISKCLFSNLCYLPSLFVFVLTPSFLHCFLSLF
jgi:hypothetical protein